MCSQNLHEHHTIECALCDVHLEKKKVKLYYNNISIHLGAENTEVYFLKFIIKKKPKYFQPMKFPLKIKEILWSQSSKFHNWNREIIII